ncbi:MAG: hypothetical protein AB7V77_03565 [Candidatus Woesearchaeota archaeon]
MKLIKNDIFKYLMVFQNIMTTQINLRLDEDFLEKAKQYAKIKGFLNVQEFFREAAREKLFDDEIREDYLKKLHSQEATTFLSIKDTEEFHKKLKIKSEL